MVALAPASAFAARRVLVIPFAPGPGAQVALSDRFNRTLATEAARVRLTPPERSGAGRLSAAERRARGLYRARRFDEAGRVLRAALRHGRRHPEPLARTAYARAQVMLAAISLRGGDEHAALRALEAVARVAPEFRIRAGRYPPLMARELSVAHRRSARAGRGRLEVDGPSGARLYLDGRFIGTLPGARAIVAKGDHHLRLVGAAGEDFSEWVEVDRRTRIPVVFPPPAHPDPLPREVAEQGLTAELATELNARCRRAGAEGALVGMAQRTGSGGVKILTALYVESAAGFVRLEPVELAEDEDATSDARTIIAQVMGALRGHAGTVSLPASLEGAPVARAGQGVSASGSPGRGVVTASGTPPEADGTEPGVTSGADASAPVQGDRSASASNPQQSPDLRDPLRPTDDHGHSGALDLGAAQGESSTVLGPSALGPAPAEAESSGSFFSRVPTWVWIAGGVGLACAAGATWYGISRANRPVQGQVTATW